MRSNSIGDEEANLLAQILRVSIDNFIAVEGANLLAEALGVNIFLSSLDLDSNSIGDEGANSLDQN